MKPLTSISHLIVLLLLSISVMAQTATLGENPTQWRITEKEVIAVQAELRRQGYYDAKLTGVLDRATREGVRNYQSENGLSATGRIDRPTYEHLGLDYPATGKERESERRNGTLPSVGYGVKDTAVSAGRAVGGVGSKVKGGTMAGYEKTKEVGSGAVSKTKGMAQTVGGAASKGVKTLSRGTQRATDTMVGRRDEDVQTEVREILKADQETEKWYSEVNSGVVTIRTKPEHSADIGAVVSSIRKVAGVKAVYVITE